MEGFLVPFISCLLTRGSCWTYAVEPEVQTCRSALKAESVTAFVTDTQYIIMSDPPEDRRDIRSPPFQRTHTTKISQRLMAELRHHLNATVFWPMISERQYKDNHQQKKLFVNCNSSHGTAIFLTNTYIPFMAGALTALLLVYILHG